MIESARALSALHVAEKYSTATWHATAADVYSFQPPSLHTNEMPDAMEPMPLAREQFPEYSGVKMSLQGSVLSVSSRTTLRAKGGEPLPRANWYPRQTSWTTTM